MTFEYTYRDSTGGVRSGRVSAGTRASAFALLKRDGIVPVSLKEASPEEMGNSSSGMPVRGVAAGTLVVLLSLVCWWSLSMPSRPEESQKAAASPKSSSGMAPTKKAAAHGPEAVAASNVTRKTRQSRLPAPSSLSDEVRMAKAALRTNTVVQVDTNRPRSVFKTSVEQVMSFLFNASVGDLPPPLPNLPPHELARIEEILNTPNAIAEGDTEEVAQRKEMVEKAKSSLKDYMEQGGTPQEFLSFYHAQLRKFYDERLDAQKSVMKILREEPEMAGEYIKRVNGQLAERGIKPVHIPRHFLEKAGLPVSRKQGE